MTTADKQYTGGRASTLVLACLGVFIAYLPITTVAISLPAIQRALNASTAELAWVQDAFVLPLAALVLTAGVVGDVRGRKKVFQAGLLLAALGAGVALCAPNILTLWIGQAIAGTGSAALLPTTLALISHAVPDHRERGKYIGMWAMALLAALAVGPVIAGVILEHAAWRWIYLLPVPASLVVLALAGRMLTDSHAAYGRRLDWPGQITATSAITAVTYGLIEGGAGSFTDERVVAALLLGAAALVAFVVVERRSAGPMLDLTLFRSPAFTATALVALISFLALIGFFFALSLYFGMVQQLDTLQAGLRLILVPTAAIAASIPAGRLMHRLSARAMISLGLLVITVSLLTLTALDADTSYGAVAWRLVLLGLGMGVVMTPMTAVAVGSVPHRLAGMASAGNNAFRQIGSALGPAVLGTMLSTKALATLPAHLATAGVTGSEQQKVIAAAEAGGLGAATHLDLGTAAGQVYTALGQSLLDGLRLCLIVAAFLTLVAALFAFVLLRRPRRSAPAEEPLRPAVHAH